MSWLYFFFVVLSIVLIALPSSSRPPFARF